MYCRLYNRLRGVGTRSTGFKVVSQVFLVFWFWLSVLVGLVTFARVLPRLAKHPDRCEGRIVCWEPLLLVERPAQAAGTPNPTLIHLSCGLKSACYAEPRGEPESKKASLEGGFGGEP